MNTDFTVERVALHLVKKEGFTLAKDEIDFAVFSEPDRASIETFFSGHLKHLWTAPEVTRTCAAKFQGPSGVQSSYNSITKSPSDFFDHSCQMAKLLHEVSQKTNASPGLLMVIWLSAKVDPRKFLALFKMDPERSDKVALREENGKLLLDLAVRHIDQALPDPGDRVLKWAVTPHPIRPAYDVKVSDNVNRKEPAQYFMAFLGCEARPSEKQQAQAILEALPAYAKECHPKQDLRTALPELIEQIQQEPVITPDVIVRKIKESKAFDGFNKKKFLQQLTNRTADDLYVSSSVLRATKLQYKLPSGIVIKGPRAEMESLVEIRDENGEKEFRIRTPSYEESYVH